MRSDWSISVCSADDLDAVVDLVNAAYRGERGQAGWTSEIGMLDGQRINLDALRADLAVAAAAHVSILTSRDAAELLACVRVEHTTAAGGRSVCSIGMLAVRPGAQDRGLGRVLLQHAENEGRAAGAQVARITVVSVRDSLIAWYERQGYRRTGETEQFPYEDARFGTPLRADLQFVALEKPLIAIESSSRT
ncbi:MAG: GNAT family N-acetyltransferase [Steroidobacteraceae bacterium]